MRRMGGYTLGALLIAAPTANAGTCTVPRLEHLSHNGPNLNKPTVQLLDPATYPAALCNDGTSAGYVFRPGTTAGLTRWIIQLQGGGFCENNTTCAKRNESLISTSGLKNGGRPHGSFAGILSANPSVNPDFYDANAVRILYCSSDLWTGNRTPEKPRFNRQDAAHTWHFRGRAIARAVIQDLATRGFAAATQILLTGDSAGGVGILLNANDLLPQLPPSARTVIAADAGYTLSIGAFDLNAPQTLYVAPARPTPGQIVLAAGHQFWRGRGDALCAAAAKTEGEQDQCDNTSFIMSAGYINSPIEIVQALEDKVQLEIDGLSWHRPKPGTPEAIYAAAFAAGMTASMSVAAAYTSIYAPYAWLHEFLTGNAFNDPHAFPRNGALTAQQAVHRWYLDPCDAKTDIGTTLE